MGRLSGRPKIVAWHDWVRCGGFRRGQAGLGDLFTWYGVVRLGGVGKGGAWQGDLFFRGWARPAVVRLGEAGELILQGKAAEGAG